MGAIRTPAVAGTFYPADPGRLRAIVEGFLAATGAPGRAAPKAIIAPHAGYVYSGPVAGAAFASLSVRVGQIRRVVVIGPAHFVAFEGVAAPTSEAFRTPLGDLHAPYESRFVCCACRAMRHVNTGRPTKRLDAAFKIGWMPPLCASSPSPSRNQCITASRAACCRWD